MRNYFAHNVTIADGAAPNNKILTSPIAIPIFFRRKLSNFLEKYANLLPHFAQRLPSTFSNPELN